MNDQVDNDPDLRQELRETNDLLIGSQKALEKIGHIGLIYTKLSTAKKPSWVGIFLVFASVLLEVFFTLPSREHSLSEGFTSMLFVSGMIALGFGAMLETVADYLHYREICKEKEEALEALKQTRQKAENIFSRFRF